MREAGATLLRRALGRNPLDVIGIVVLLVAAGAILANALYRQPGPHPAPIFSVKPRPVAAEPAEIVPPLAAHAAGWRGEAGDRRAGAARAGRSSARAREVRGAAHRVASRSDRRHSRRTARRA